MTLPVFRNYLKHHFSLDAYPGFTAPTIRIVNVNVNVNDNIFWLHHTIESCNWIDFISVAYASWCHLNCGRTQRKAATINQLACPNYSLYVQLLWYPMYYPEEMRVRVSPVQWSKPHSILALTQDSNPGGRIQNHKRWPLHYHCTFKGIVRLSNAFQPSAYD